MAAQPSTAPVNYRRAVLNTVRGSLGNLVEWYDVYVYTVFASYFEERFFGGDEPNAGIYTMAIFAVTFLMRPVGSLFFGRYADRHGRRPALVLSVSLMAAASGVVALTPGRERIGVSAVVVLVICRLVQGFATGGEYGTSATYMSEAATADRRGFFSSFQYLTLVGGHLLAQSVLLVLQVFLDDGQLAAFGWRIAFGLGAVAALVVLYLRRRMDETLAAPGRRRSGSLAELLTVYPRQLLVCFLVTLGGTVVFYTYSVNGPSSVKAAYEGHGLTATWINFTSLAVLALLQPVGGLISDHVGRQPLLVFFGVGALAWTWFTVGTLKDVTAPLVSWGMLVTGYVILTGYTSINAVVKAELFPAHVRALGVGFGYALANSAFGGTAPVLYEAAKKHALVSQFAFYVTVCVAVSLIVYVFVLRNRAPTYLDEDGPALSATTVSPAPDRSGEHERPPLKDR